MRYYNSYKIPRAIFVNKLDDNKADFTNVVHALQDAYGPECVPQVLPVGHGQGLGRVEHLTDGDLGDIAESVEEIKITMIDVVQNSMMN